MKKYILIQNEGEIESNSFELIGASTKRSEHGKIGFFGSGLKYSIAYMMRNKIEFKVFSGMAELVFSTMPETLKDQTFERICINDKPTSYTVTMGPTWTEDWFVLREIYCNAVDESGCQLMKNIENISPLIGHTRIYIETTAKLNEVVNNWDAYFADERTPLFVANNVYTCYLGNNDINGQSTQNVSVYEKTNGTMFRKNIRCYTNEFLEYDYGFDFVSVNEDRTANNIGGLEYCFCNLMGSFANERYVSTVLRSGKQEHTSREYRALKSNSVDKKCSEQWVDFSKKFMLVVEEVSGRFTDQIQKTNKEVLYIPQYFAKRLKKDLPDISIFGIGGVVGDSAMEEITPTPKMEFLLKDVLKSLEEMRYIVRYDISIVHFTETHILGQADINAKQIYLSDTVFDKGKREIAMTIMEENEHIISECKDETREFQNHLFSSWLKTMEETTALFL